MKFQFLRDLNFMHTRKIYYTLIKKKNLIGVGSTALSANN